MEREIKEEIRPEQEAKGKEKTEQQDSILLKPYQLLVGKFLLFFLFVFATTFYS